MSAEAKFVGLDVGGTTMKAAVVDDAGVPAKVATLDTNWQGAPASALLRCARQLSADLGHAPTRPHP